MIHVNKDFLVSAVLLRIIITIMISQLHHPGLSEIQTTMNYVHIVNVDLRETVNKINLG